MLSRQRRTFSRLPLRGYQHGGNLLNNEYSQRAVRMRAYFFQHAPGLLEYRWFSANSFPEWQIMFRRARLLIAITFLLLVSFAIWREVDRRIQEWETVSKLTQYAVFTSESNSPPWLDDVVGTRVASWLFPPRVTEAFFLTTSAEPEDAAMAWLAQLPRLESVEVTGSNQFSDSGIAHLKQLRKLTHLSVWDTDLSDLGLVHVGKLDRLKGLTLAYVPVTDEGLKHLTGLTNLESLQLISTNVTQRGVADLREALPHCKIVALSIARPDES